MFLVIQNMDAVDTFCKYLEERGLPSQIIQKCQEERMTKKVLQYMDKDDLATLFPAMGDRLRFVPIMRALEVSFRARLDVFQCWLN